MSPVALDKRSTQPKPNKAQGTVPFSNCFFENQIYAVYLSHYFIDFFEDGKDGKDVKVGNSERQNGPVVVKASKDKKKINQKVCDDC